MLQSLDKVWTDLCFELEATFFEIRQATNWLAHFDPADVGPSITTPTYDHCWVTRNKRTVVECKMRLTSRAEGDNERSFEFRLDAAAALPVIRLEEDGTEVPESAAIAARYLLDTFRELTTASPQSDSVDT